MDLSAASIRRAVVPRRIAAGGHVRRGLEDWLRDADLRKYGLPPHAIAIVRQLRVEWSRVGGGSRQLRHDALGVALRDAARPAVDQRMAGAAPAVWFADLSELLACMTRDALAGALEGRWWWRALLGPGIDRDAVIRHWIGSARSVPAAVGRLEALPAGATWFECWTSTARVALLTALAQHYPLSSAAWRFVETGAALTPLTAHEVAMHPAAGLVEPASRDTAPGDTTSGPSSVRWSPLRLQVLCLQLARDPGSLLDPRVVERDLLPAVARRIAIDDPVSLPAVGRRQPDREAVALRPPSAAPDESAGNFASADHGAAPVEGGEVQASLCTEAAAPEPWRMEAARHAAAREGPGAAPQATNATESGPAPGQLSPALDADIAFETCHGGLFFVVNAALQLGLYGDFSTPQHRGLDISPWRFLYDAGVAFGRRLFVDDPLAAWLMHFPGAEAAPPAPDPGEPWRIDREWLEPFDQDRRPLRVLIAAERLTLVHAAGFVIADAPVLDARHEPVIAGELAFLGLGDRVVVPVAAPRRRAMVASRAPAPTSTSRRVLPYVRARLCLALGLRDARRLSGLLLRTTARVRAGGERVDVWFSLERLPIAVRLSGLDRDPGWVPAAGRDLRFHFE